jgi:predicted MFS family arabinose efflux permease
VVFLEGFLIFGAMAFIPLYLHNRFNLSMSAAGALMGFFGLGGLAYISGAKYFVRRLGELGLALLGTVAVAGAWFLISLVGFWSVIIPAAFLLGIGYYMLHNTLQTNATQMAPQVRGTAVSLFASAFFLGQSAGVSTGATVFEKWGGGSLFDWAGLLMLPLGLGFAFLLRQRMERNRNTV